MKHLGERMCCCKRLTVIINDSEGVRKTLFNSGQISINNQSHIFRSSLGEVVVDDDVQRERGTKLSSRDGDWEVHQRLIVFSGHRCRER